MPDKRGYRTSEIAPKPLVRFSDLPGLDPSQRFFQTGSLLSADTFGLAVFVACIGLATGPEALKQTARYGAALPVAGIAVSLVPSLFSLYYGKYVLKLHPVVLCGALCSRQASTPALNALTLAAGSNAPVLGYTVPYTIANVLLTLAGPLVVFLT